jgi:hypothetical protein
MNTKDMKQLLDDTHFKMCLLSSTKGYEYAGESDRLSNFKEPALDLGVSPDLILWIALDKHLRAIRTYIRNRRVHSEPIEERIDDAILYLILLKGLIQEREAVSASLAGPSILEAALDAAASRISDEGHSGPKLFRGGDGWVDRGEVAIDAPKGKLNSVPKE